MMKPNLFFYVCALLLIFVAPTDAQVCDDYPCYGTATCVENVLSISCDAQIGQVNTPYLVQDETMNIAVIPAGTRDVSISMESQDADIDLKLRTSDGTCLAGYGCLLSYDGYHWTYDGMEIYFSGDDTNPPVKEGIIINYVTQTLYLQVNAYEAGTGVVFYEWSGIDDCEDAGSSGRTCLCPYGEHYVESAGCYQDYGCTDSNAENYDSHATHDDGSCSYAVYGCTDYNAQNYDSDATVDDGSCSYAVYGCTNYHAENYDSDATVDDGSCIYATTTTTDPDSNDWDYDYDYDYNLCLPIQFDMYVAEYGHEITVNVGDVCSWNFGDSSYGNTENKVCCLEPDTFYTVECADSFGDGWHGGSLSVDGVEICQLSSGQSVNHACLHVDWLYFVTVDSFGGCEASFLDDMLLNFENMDMVLIIALGAGLVIVLCILCCVCYCCCCGCSSEKQQSKGQYANQARRLVELRRVPENDEITP